MYFKLRDKYFLKVINNYAIDHFQSKKCKLRYLRKYEGWNCNNGNYLFTTDTK